MKLCPICVNCAKEMRCLKNDFPVVSPGEMVSLGDKFGCTSCDNKIVVGFGNGRHISEVGTATAQQAMPFSRA